MRLGPAKSVVVPDKNLTNAPRREPGQISLHFDYCYALFIVSNSMDCAPYDDNHDHHDRYAHERAKRSRPGMTDSHSRPRMTIHNTAATATSTRPQVSARRSPSGSPSTPGSWFWKWSTACSSNSVALLADAGHNMSDVFGLGVAWSAAVLSKRAPTQRFTYGLGGTSILAALFNAAFLLVVIGGLSWEAIGRFWNPQPAPERR